jgi:UPF0755 protein
MRSSSRRSRLPFTFVALAIACAGGDGTPARVVIPAGSSFRAATDSLVSAGIIRSPKLFRAYATIQGSDRAVKPGTYLLRRGTSWGAILQSLTKGWGVIRTVTIPEGLALSAIEPLIARTLNVAPESVAAAVRDPELRERLHIPTQTLEGYLFPETYQFTDGTSPREAVRDMVTQFESQWDAAWNERLDSLNMSRHQVITLASIVEKEARLDAERPVIAAVYHNRLRIGMPLQADPTVQYARGAHTSRVLHKDLAIQSPYNTYRRAGLPPGPIASPGRASIEATLFPANVPYRYFVAHPDGHHEFRVTYDEHRAAIRAIQQARRGKTRE